MQYLKSNRAIVLALRADTVRYNVDLHLHFEQIQHRLQHADVSLRRERTCCEMPSFDRAMFGNSNQNLNSEDDGVLWCRLHG